MIKSLLLLCHFYPEIAEGPPGLYRAVRPQMFTFSGGMWTLTLDLSRVILGLRRLTLVPLWAIFGHRESPGAGPQRLTFWAWRLTLQLFGLTLPGTVRLILGFGNSPCDRPWRLALWAWWLTPELFGLTLPWGNRGSHFGLDGSPQSRLDWPCPGAIEAHTLGLMAHPRAVWTDPALGP